MPHECAGARGRAVVRPARAGWRRRGRVRRQPAHDGAEVRGDPRPGLVAERADQGPADQDLRARHQLPRAPARTGGAGRPLDRERRRLVDLPRAVRVDGVRRLLRPALQDPDGLRRPAEADRQAGPAALPARRRTDRRRLQPPREDPGQRRPEPGTDGRDQGRRVPAGVLQAQLLGPATHPERRLLHLHRQREAPALQLLPVVRGARTTRTRPWRCRSPDAPPTRTASRRSSSGSPTT